MRELQPSPLYIFTRYCSATSGSYRSGYRETCQGRKAGVWAESKGGISGPQTTYLRFDYLSWISAGVHDLLSSGGKRSARRGEKCAFPLEGSPDTLRPSACLSSYWECL